MNILIIENERPAADRLVRLLMKIDKSITIMGVIETVEEDHKLAAGESTAGSHTYGYTT